MHPSPRALAGVLIALAAAGCADDVGPPDADAAASGDVAADDERAPPPPDDAAMLGDVAPASDVLATDGGAPDVPLGDGGPFVAIVAPPDGTTVGAPAAFRITARGVTAVRMFADDWPLGAAWDPSTRDNLVYMFTGPARTSLVELLGYDARGAERARDAIHVNVPAAGPTDTGTAVATFYNTYYYLAREADYTGTPDATLYTGTCTPIAMVAHAFSDAVCIEGSGVLADGRVINASSSCTCGRPCPTGGTVCYTVLDPTRFPWGEGASGGALIPLRSWAVDRTVVPLGTTLYVAMWDGVAVPSVTGLGGFVHDGCFRADDVGGGIRGDHFDFFAGTRPMWLALERIFPTRTNFAVRRDAGRCAYLLR